MLEASWEKALTTYQQRANVVGDDVVPVDLCHNVKDVGDTVDGEGDHASSDGKETFRQREHN